MRVAVPHQIDLRQPLDERLAEFAERVGAGHRPGQVEERRRRDFQITREARCPDDPEPCRSSPSLDRAEQPSLADPRLTRQEQQVASPAESGGEPPVGEIEEVVAADEERRDERARPTHRAKHHPTPSPPGGTSLAWASMRHIAAEGRCWVVACGKLLRTDSGIARTPSLRPGVYDRFPRAHRSNDR